MPYAIMSSGGKDSTLALDRARRNSLEVHYLVNIYESSTNRVRFHGVRHELILQQAEFLGLEPITRYTTPDDFEQAFASALEELKEHGVEGVIFGNIHLSDVRSWYEERVREAGFEHVEPIWGDPPIELAWEIVERGYQLVVVSVDSSQGARDLLGREFDADLVTELGCTDGLDPCGERGEYHTFVFDGPEFRYPVKFRSGDTVEIEGHRFLDLVPSDV